MKRFYNIAILCLALLAAFSAQGQALRNNPNLQARLTQAKLFEIQKALALSDAKLQQLTPIYKRYETEINALNYAKQGVSLRGNLDSLSTEQADKVITAQLDNAVKISSIRRKYYDEFKTVLTPQQVIKLFKSEAQIKKRVLQELRKRMRNRPENN